MLRRSVEDLARDLRQRRESGDAMPVLLLGAGASVDSGVGVMGDLYRYVGCADFAAFSAVMEPLTSGERYRLLARFLQAVEPERVTPGYTALAALIATGYLNVVLTTNLDPLLDDALSSARLKRKDYLLLVNGLVLPALLSRLLEANSPRVKVVKLHGDLLYRCMAWTPAEMEDFVSAIGQPLHRHVATRDLLVVGHSLRDEAIRDLVGSAGDVIWYAHPEEAPAFLSTDRRVRAVIGAEARFEPLFTTIAERLEVMPATQPGGGGVLPDGSRGPTMDDASRALVRVLGPFGPNSTGFVLTQPHVILMDAFAARSAVHEDTVHLKWGGMELSAPVIGDLGGPFGPLVARVPDGLRAVGLPLDARAISPGEPVHVAVAVGPGTGMSSGHATTAVEMDHVIIEPVGRVEGLVDVAVRVAPGSSGAPVLDGDMAVRGFVVAKAADHAYLLPASRWAAGLAAIDVGR